MTPGRAVLGAAVGLVAGVLSGLFGVGGGILMTPGVQVLLGAPPIVALATPLPAIFPTAAAGAMRYRRARALDLRAASWMAAAGTPGAVGGAALAEVIDTHLLLIATAALLAWQAVGILRGRARSDADARPREGRPLAWAATGLAAGIVSGLLGVGGGIVMVPLLAGWLGMPLRRALGTSLAAIVAIVVPGAAVHAINANVDWAIFAALVVGAVPGARIGSAIALGAGERTLRALVGTFLLVVALAYGTSQVVASLRG
jgi:hypothetical protein